MTEYYLDLSIDTEDVRQKLTAFIQEQSAEAGFERAVIGVSGGVDSALSCFLAAEALGPKNVLAVRMPYKTSSPESLEHAQMVIEQTGVESLTVPITVMVDALIEQFPNMNAIRRGNVMARARMIVLYDQSAAFDGLVVGTGNKTEALLGYTTLYGDSACAYNPIGDLYKAQVRQLARAVGVPEAIIEKPPSADLWPGQTDEDELGFTYEAADHLLYLLVEKEWPPEDCVQAGFPEDFVREVIDRSKKNAFKFSLPPIAKLTDHTIGVDPIKLW